MLVSDVLYVVVVCDVVCDDMDGDEGSCKVEWLILCCLGVLVTDERTDYNGHCRVTFATENVFFYMLGGQPNYLEEKSYLISGWMLFDIYKFTIHLTKKKAIPETWYSIIKYAVNLMKYVG